MPRQKYIQAGDIFQANLSSGLRLTQRLTAGLFIALCRRLTHPFASYWQTPWGIVISCSERLVHLQTANTHVSTNCWDEIAEPPAKINNWHKI